MVGLADLVRVAIEDAEPRLVVVGLVWARLAPVVYLAPTFGGGLLPGPLRAVFSVSLALTLGLNAPPPGAIDSLWFAFATEFAIGVSVGLLAAVPFEAARASGQLWDTLRGAGTGVVALGDASSSPLGQALYLLLLATVVGGGGDRAFVELIGETFRAWPVGQGLFSPGDFADLLVAGSAALLVCVLAACAPAIVATAITDFVLGLLGRLAPALPLFFLGLPVKAWLLAALLGLALPGVLEALTALFVQLTVLPTQATS